MIEPEEKQKTIDDMMKPQILYWLKKGEKIGLFDKEDGLLEKQR